MNRYVCIHGHFYQPPRENPWLEFVELQDSAYPYHDWNQRVTAEAYAPNSASRILDEEGQLVHIVNNYSRISFNFGPTLLAWLEALAPSVYAAILEADRRSAEAFSGHGSAMAQAYGHLIMPLANLRDKHTQVIWGVRDFQHRFGRMPEGMWLPETAVDLETLDILALHDIRFTVLAPHQARRIRPLGTGRWRDTPAGSIDTTRPYLVRLRSGRSIAVFFYDGELSRAVAFERLLENGVAFAGRLAEKLDNDAVQPRLSHIATDGETYGHHHRFGDMALAAAIHHIDAAGLGQMTNYAEHLARHPPADEAEIVERTSWSCEHGVERWRSDCGCSSGGHPGWRQEWRKPLRAALDCLRDELATRFEADASQIFRDPWAARDDYIRVILDRSTLSRERFLQQHAIKNMAPAGKVRAWKLMELQRHAMLMYTSCGWFFDDLSGIETVQVIQYAGRAIQLGQELFGGRVEDQFLAGLEKARSNIPAQGSGRQIYESYVRPSALGLKEVGAHFAVSHVFEDNGPRDRIYCYRVRVEDAATAEAGVATLKTGHIGITSEITHESASLMFCVLYLGGASVNAGVLEYPGESSYRRIIAELTDPFVSGEFPDVVRVMDREFAGSTYSLRALFRDQQRRALDRILESALGDAERLAREMRDRHYPLVRFLAEVNTPIPQPLRAEVEFVLTTDLRVALAEAPLDLPRIRQLLDEAQELRVGLDSERIAFEMKNTIERMMSSFAARPHDGQLLEELAAAVEMARSAPFGVDLWEVQNVYFEMLGSVYAERGRSASSPEDAAWLDRFASLGRLLSIKVPAPEP